MRFLLIASLLLASACGDEIEPELKDTTSNESALIEIEGSWTGTNGDESIASDSWEDQWATYSVVGFDNVLNIAITQNAADADYSPLLFNKVLWTEVASNEFSYCIVAFGEVSEDAALASPATADKEDLTTGCSSFPWTTLTRQ